MKIDNIEKVENENIFFSEERSNEKNSFEKVKLNSMTFLMQVYTGI